MSVTCSGSTLIVIGKICSGCPQYRILDEEFGAVSRLYLYALLPLFGEQQEKTLDEESMKAYKSLKAYKYFADSYIRNVWAGEPQEQDDAIVVRCHCLSSLKVKKVYVVHLVKKSGDVLSASCTCISGKGEACSHIPALMFYLKDFMRQGHSDLPTNTAATSHLQQWPVPPKRDVYA